MYNQLDMGVIVSGLGEKGLSSAEVGRLELVDRRWEIVAGATDRIDKSVLRALLFVSIDEATMGKEVLRIFPRLDEVADIIIRRPHEFYGPVEFVAAFIDPRPKIISDISDYTANGRYRNGDTYLRYNGDANDFEHVFSGLRQNVGGSVSYRRGGFSYEPVDLGSINTLAEHIGTPPILPLEWVCDTPPMTELSVT